MEPIVIDVSNLYKILPSIQKYIRDLKFKICIKYKVFSFLGTFWNEILRFFVNLCHLKWTTRN
jgi:hypothetical protein